MKYLIYRFPDVLDWDDDDGYSLRNGVDFPVQPELVGVEYGEDIYSATDSLIRAVLDDLSATVEFADAPCDCWPPRSPCALEQMSNMCFDYEMSGIVHSNTQEENIVLHFGIIEREE